MASVSRQALPWRGNEAFDHWPEGCTLERAVHGPLEKLKGLPQGATPTADRA